MADSLEDKQQVERGSERPEEVEATERVRLRAQLDLEHQLYLRTLADFDNYRRRVERERAGAAHAGKRELVVPLLEVLTDFDRALEHLGTVPDWMSSGFYAIYERLNNILRAQGIEAYESVGHTFDPALHEAAGSTETEDAVSGTVVAELSRGYRWGDDVLRPARVNVAR